MKKVSLGLVCIMTLNLASPVISEASQLSNNAAEVKSSSEEKTAVEETETEPSESSTEESTESVPESTTESETTDSTDLKKEETPEEEPEAPTEPEEAAPDETEGTTDKPNKPEVEQPAEKPADTGKPVGKKPAVNASKENHSAAAAQSSPSVSAINQSTISFSRNLTTEQFIMTIGETARDIGQEHDLYASVMIAQAILESGSGSSSLSGAPNFNLFGIKGSYKGNSIAVPTQEDDGKGNLYTITAAFRKYDNYQESCEDYTELLKQDFYKGAWKSAAKTPQEAAAYLQGRYATDTSYGAKLNGLIETYHLADYDQAFVPSDKETLKTHAVKKAVLQYLGVPYVWGGTKTTGFDCSGLVQYVFKESLDVDTGRVTTDQEHLGREVPLDQLRTGDLLFWGRHGATTHVAIYIGDNLFVHAPQTGDVVKVTTLDEFRPDFAKRIFDL